MTTKSTKLDFTGEERPSEGHFTHRNEAFTCEGCGQTVLPRSVSCRNHCPFCLTSKHVDLFPGDRLNPCQGLMDMVGYETHSKKGLVLLFKCRRCGGGGKNIAAHEDPVQPDRYEMILAKG
jgi:hypothetical protein